MQLTVSKGVPPKGKRNLFYNLNIYLLPLILACPLLAKIMFLSSFGYSWFVEWSPWLLGLELLLFCYYSRTELNFLLVLSITLISAFVSLQRQSHETEGTELGFDSLFQRNLFAVFELLFGIVLNFAQGFPDRDAGDKFHVSTEGRCYALKLACVTGIIPFLSSWWEFRFIRIFAIRSLGLAWDSWISHVQFKEWEAHWHATTEQKAGLEHQLDILQSSFSGGNEGPFQRIDDTHLSFLAKLSHELRTMMNGVSGMISLLSDSGMEPEQQEYVMTLERAVESLMTLINDSLSFSRIETHETLSEVTFNLESLLEDAFDFVANRVGDKTLDVSYDVSSDVPPFLVGDPSYLRTILTNLISNGIKFTAEGEVAVDVELFQKVGEGHVILDVKVSDTGMGISPEEVEHIFEPFSKLSAQTIPSYGGSGLGLAICQKLARILQGNISVESKPGKGSTFTLRVPFGVDSSAPLTPQMSPKGLEDAGIFIIDDNERILKVLAKQLTSWGCRVQTATNWVDGMKELKRSAVVMGKPYNLLLLDYMMPGLNGNEVARLIRKDNSIVKFTPIVLMGSRAQKKGNPMGVEGWLLKPLRKNHLLEVVSRTCGTSPDIRKKTLSKSSSRDSSRVRLNVLVAEDNPMNQRILRSIVERLGHHCTVTSDGEATLVEVAKKHYDVIFMDCRMPKVDGFAATQRIREREAAEGLLHGTAPHIPIVALTADVMHGTRELCLQVGMDDYLYKPVKKVDIEEILQGLVEKGATSSPQKTDSAEFESTKTSNILLVEDNVVNARIGSVILSRHKFHVHVATHGAMALEMVKAQHDLYDVILMDMHMPGMDGIAATEAIREFEREESLPPVPIIALTADTTEGFRGTCLQAGCSEYMTKPVDYPLLVQLVKKFVTDYSAKSLKVKTSTK